MIPSHPRHTGSRQAVLDAEYLIEKSDPESLQRGLALLEDARTRAPDDPQIWLGLAQARFLLYLQGLAPAEPARFAVNRALRLAPGSARAHSLHGDLASLVDWQFEASRRSYEEALRLDPKSTRTRLHYASYFLIVGNPEAAIEQVESVLASDPPSALLAGDAGWTFLHAGQSIRAEDLCRRALRLEPTSRHARECLVHSLTLQHRDRDATLEADRLLTQLGLAAGATTEPSSSNETDQNLIGYHQALLGLVRDGPHTSVQRALHLAAMGEIEKSLDALDEAWARRLPLLVLRIRDPRLSNLQGNQRFERLLSALGLQSGVSAVEPART